MIVKIYLKAFSIILILLSNVFSASLLAEEDEHCGASSKVDGIHFLFSIHRSFHGTTVFKLCKQKESMFLVTLDYNNKDDSENSKRMETISALDSERFSHFINLRNQALDYNTKDFKRGLDGSTWCLQVKRSSTHTVGCFWSPQNNSKERGLFGISNLGEYLWDFTKQQELNGKLY